MVTTMNLTENETKLLKAIRNSEYHSGPDTEENRVGQEHAVWVDCLWGFEGKRLFGGVMSSLTKKGLAGTDGECAWLTAEGFKAVEGKVDEKRYCFPVDI